MTEAQTVYQLGYRAGYAAAEAAVRAEFAALAHAIGAGDVLEVARALDAVPAQPVRRTPRSHPHLRLVVGGAR